MELPKLPWEYWIESMQAPLKSCSLFFNYKGSFLINLMALVDYEYRFTDIDIGQYGNKFAVFKDSASGRPFMDNELDVPDHVHLQSYAESGPVSYHFVANETFQLQCDLMSHQQEKLHVCLMMT